MGKDEEILAHRKEVYEQAKLRSPNRWSGEIRNWEKVKYVYLNPDNQKSENEEKRRHKFTTLGDN